MSLCGENMIKQRKIELLAPAKNLECGIEAVNHGADAVYIGAPKFGARAAAVNSLEDIAALAEYAHLYNVRVYVTVNTILKEEELAETERMIWDLYRIGVDALIVQDMGITFAWQYANGQPYTGESPFPDGCRLSSGGIGARAFTARDTQYPRGLSGDAFGGLCAWCALCELQWPVLRQSGVFRQKCQSGGVRTVLPPSV